MVDSHVVQEVYQAGKSAGADQKVMLALFEACYVESGFENLKSGDKDSVGVLQQRSGWGSVAQRENPTYAATKFVQAAKPIESKYKTSGALAQGVQKSAFGSKYDMAAGTASILLMHAEKKYGSLAPIPAPPGGGNPFPNLSGLDAITNPATWKRIAMFLIGGILIMFALAKATGNNQLEPSTKNLIKIAATVAK